MVVPLVQRLINPTKNILQRENNIVCLWRLVSDKILRRLHCYWYMKSQSEKYVHSKPKES